MRHPVGKILSFLFLLNLFFIQGVNFKWISQPVAGVNNQEGKHVSSGENVCSNIALVSEVSEPDDDDKMFGRQTGFVPACVPVNFFQDLIAFNFPLSATSQIPLADMPTEAECLPLFQRNCSFLI